MSAAVHIVPASGSITALRNACKVTVTGQSPNTLTGYDSSHYPASPTVVGYFKLSATGQPVLQSPHLSTSGDGDAEWDGVIFPAAGSWTLELINAADDSTVLATAAVTVN